MRNACLEQCCGGGQLVVRGDERAAGVENGDTRSGEALERPESGLDAVQRRQDVEAFSAMSPGRRRAIAWAGETTAPRRVFVGVTRWATTAKVLICGNVRGMSRETEGPAARPLPDCFRLVTEARLGSATATLPRSASVGPAVAWGKDARRPGGSWGWPPGRCVGSQARSLEW